MVMDATAEHALPSYVWGTRLPAWLLPGLPDAHRRKLRLDILLIEGLLTVQLPGCKEACGALAIEEVRDLCGTHPTVHIVEVGHTADRLHAEKHAEKAAQHQPLVSHLQAHGWCTQCHVVTLGVGGTVCAPLIKTLGRLGVDAPQATATLHWLHERAARMLHTLVNTRRELERKPP